MTIAVDNVGYSNKPERWNMNIILLISTFLGVIGVVASFTLYFIGFVFLKLSISVLQSFIFLKLSVAASLTVYVARTKGHFWERKPAKALFAATSTTQILAIFFTVYGIIPGLSAIGWALAGFVLLYAFVWFLITDFIKYYFYKFLRSKGRMF